MGADWGATLIDMEKKALVDTEKKALTSVVIEKKPLTCRQSCTPGPMLVSKPPDPQETPDPHEQQSTTATSKDPFSGKRFKEVQQTANRLPSNSGSIQRTANRNRTANRRFSAEPVRRFDFEQADPLVHYRL